MHSPEIVQIAPGGHETWGGQPMRVVRYMDNGLRLKGYILTPHRTAAWGTWVEVPTAATRSIGDLAWPESMWNSRENIYNGLLLVQGKRQKKDVQSERFKIGGRIDLKVVKD